MTVQLSGKSLTRPPAARRHPWVGVDPFELEVVHLLFVSQVSQEQAVRDVQIVFILKLTNYSLEL